MSTQELVKQAPQGVAPKPRYNTINELIEDKKTELQKMLPAAIGVERFTRIALATMADDRLKGCTLVSLYQSLLSAASVGLVPDGFLGHAYIVPFNNKVKKADGTEVWEKQAKMMLGYRGLMELALRSDKVLGVRANVVYQGDHFDYDEGLVTRLEHRPCPVSRRAETNEDGMGGYVMLGAYAIATVRDIPPSQSPFKFMYAEDICAIRARSKNAFGKNNKLHGPWATDPAAMWSKTVVRQLAKFLPLTPEAMKAVVEDEYTELGVESGGATLEVPRQPVQQPRREAPATVEVQTGQSGQPDHPPQEPEDESQAASAEERVQGSDNAPERPQGESASPELAFDDQPPSAAVAKDPTTIPGVTKGMPAGDGKIKKGQFRLIHARRNGVGVTEDELNAYLDKTYKSPHLSDLASANVNDVLAWLDTAKK